MRRLRRVKHNRKTTSRLTSPDFLSNLWTQLTGALVVLTSIISSVGLLVGGIGVMNIMLISVTERTSEIGCERRLAHESPIFACSFCWKPSCSRASAESIGILLGA